MKTKNKFRFLRCFTKKDIERFPNGWVTKSEVTKHVLEDLSSNDDDDDLIDKIILIQPNIWGQHILKNEYWKADTYHPSLTNKDVHTMDTEIFLIGKVIKETIQEKDHKMPKRKQSLGKTFETVLMCDSSKDQANEFSEQQCQDMLIKNIKLDVSLKLSSPVDDMTKNDLVKGSEQLVEDNINNLLKETEQLVEDNIGVETNDDKVQVYVENNQDSEENTRKRQLASSARKISPTKKSPLRKKQMIAETKDTERKKVDFMILQRVAFDFHSEDFQNYVKDWDDKVVKDHIHHLLEDGQHIRGVIDSKVKKQKGQEHADYIICWEYCTKGINNIQISMQEAFAATHLSKLLERNESSGKIADYDIKEKSGKNDFNSSIHKFIHHDVEGNPIESEDELSDDECATRLYDGNCTYYTSKRTEEDRSFETSGLKWKKDYHLNTAQGIRPPRETYLKRDYVKSFRSEIESFLAFLPINFWMWHLKVTNFYIENHRKESLTRKNPSIHKIKDIHIQELMTFYAILMQMAVKPHPGARYTECWSEQNKVWYTTCKKMSRKRFDEIRFAIHWCENKSRDQFRDSQTGKLDTLYKVRPLLTVIQQNLGRFIKPCTNLSLDETCIAIRSKFARSVTFYNPNKPKGKHHLKFYTLCENDHWCALVIKMCHRNQKGETGAQTGNNADSELNNTNQVETWARELLQDGEDDSSHFSNQVAVVGYKPSFTQNRKAVKEVKNESDEFVEDNEICDENIKDPNSTKAERTNGEIVQEVQKTIRTVTDMCRSYNGTGRIINMDNLYSSPEVFIALKNKGLYARGTVRLNRKYLPRFIKYLKKDMANLERGSYQFASNIEHNMSMHCWHDKNPVHMLSSCDSTNIDVVQRQSGKNKVTISCPVVVKKYNENMQAVDQFNHLISLFSLGESHTFTKYYKKIAMVLMDFVLVNAYLHMKIYQEQEVSPKPKKKLDRKEFMENLIDSLIGIDWAEMVREHEDNQSKGKEENWITDYSDDDNGSSSDEEEVFKDKIDYNIHQEAMNVKNNNLCRAVTIDKTLDDEIIQKTKKSKFYCKVCIFEGRGNSHRNSVYCSNHGVALCQRVNVHPQNQTVFKIGTIKEKYVNTTLIKDWKWLSPGQEKWTCWEKAHRYYIPNNLFNIKDEKNNNVKNLERAITFNMMSRPFILRKKALNETFYKRAVGTKSNKIIKRAGVEKETVKDSMIERKNNIKLELELEEI